MRVPVAVMPGLLVAIGTARRDEPVQDIGQIVLQSRLELDRPNCSRAADVENVDCASLDARGSHDRRDALSEIVHVTVAFCVDYDLLLIAHDTVLIPSIEVTFRGRQ